MWKPEDVRAKGTMEVFLDNFKKWEEEKIRKPTN
jgi:hypothetical protein